MVGTSTQSRPRRFAILGAAGAAGLATLQVFVSELHDYIRAGEIELVGFEQRQDIGGSLNPDQIHRNRYGPRHQHTIRCTPISRTRLCITLRNGRLRPPPLFTDAQTVHNYMRTYADRFGLQQYIRFNTQVTAATWDDSTNQWNFTTRPYGGQVNKGVETITHYDHLLATNGHNRRPFTPEVDGFKDWAASDSRGSIHSIWYRTPEPYRDRDVLVIGGGRSGADCSVDLSTVARKTIHSVRSAEDSDSGRIIQRGEISYFTPDGFVHFKNGKQEYVYRIIFATGYEYDCSFLTQLPVEEAHHSSDHLYNSRFHIYPLALHTFPLRAAFPPSSLAFIGIPNGAPAFTLSEVQAKLAIRQMTGKVSLDFEHELTRTLERNEALQRKHSSPLEVARAWHKFGKGNGNPYDFLDLLLQRADDSARMPKWKREFGPFGVTILVEWKKLERLGLADSWARGVGEGGVK
ncbi:unnamed protein product [Rhizoctonia solani]|uniref:Uncharacterized protein n=1 Tax=Rhizoctonia solani TaxID=456999 RepID=A0A8H3BSK4_9AGAM|nr:unnamed protein product [Rhizoctonia solani]